MVPSIYLVLISQQSGFIFIENKGQWNNEVKFKTDLKNGHLYTCTDGLVFDFFDEEKLEELYEKHYIKPTNSRNNRLKKHAYKVSFNGANFNSTIKGDQPTINHFNFFKGDKTKWKSNVKGFHELTFQEIYSNIDLKIYTKYFGYCAIVIGDSIRKGTNIKIIVFFLNTIFPK